MDLRTPSQRIADGMQSRFLSQLPVGTEPGCGFGRMTQDTLRLLRARPVYEPLPLPMTSLPDSIMTQYVRVGLLEPAPRYITRRESE
jgi:hypothetical protein